MSQNHSQSHLGSMDWIISTVTVGVFFILAGTIFFSIPGLGDKIVAFFNDFTTVRLPSTTDVFLPAPAIPSAHLVVYNAVGEFSLTWGVFQILVLALRFAFHSPLRRKAETISGIVFWLGLYYLISLFLTSQVTVTVWFVFWSAVIALAGASLIARAIILAVLPRKQ